MKEPGNLVAELARANSLPEGIGDRFTGYAVIGLPFRSGHVLALRRFFASSIGTAYTSIWHRDPDGVWTFYQDVAPSCSCPRYFGSGVHENVVCPIQVVWNGPWSLQVSATGKDGLLWDIDLQETLTTRSLNLAAGLMPDEWWRNPNVLKMMSRVAPAVLRTGSMNLTGRSPNGQTFVANPRMVWPVRRSRAVLGGINLGPTGPMAIQARLGDFVIPQRGLFAIADAFVKGDAVTCQLSADAA
jgi:hypothetical protein